MKTLICSIFTFFFALFLLGLLNSCGQQSLEPVVQDRIQIENDEGYLSQRIDYFDDDVHVEAGVGKTGLSQFKKTMNFSLKLRARVSPPIVDGLPLHASHVTFYESEAYVSYSTVHNQYRGAVEIIDISEPHLPVIKSQALFLDTDITIAVASNGKVFLGEATASDNNSDFDSPASLEIIDLNRGLLTTNSQRFDLPSFNANDVACFDNSIFVTSGTTNGALTIFAKHQLSLKKQISLEGAKALGRNENHILVLEGTGTNLHIFDRATQSFIKTVHLGCDNFFQEKAEMAVIGELAYISAHRCGVLVVDLTNETVSTAIPAPPGGQTNAVSVTNDLVFSANGSDGLLISAITPTGLEPVGEAKFDGSTNFVAAKDKIIFVANGSGGLIIIEIIDDVEPIIVSAEGVVRADRGENGFADLNVAAVNIQTSGNYQIVTNVWYNSGDKQRNESFYLELEDGNGNSIKALNPNAGVHLVVPDDPGGPHTVLRESGIFYLSQGEHSIDIYHYAKIAEQYPQFLNNSFEGPESVYTQGFRLEYIGP